MSNDPKINPEGLPLKVTQSHAQLAKDELGIEDCSVVMKKDKDGNIFYIACCAFCFEPNVRCLPISYERIDDFYNKLNATPFALCCCDDCFKSDRTELFVSYLDAVIIMELARWSHKDDPEDPFWKRKGIIRNNDDFYTLKKLAIQQGVFARESNRHSSLKYKKTLRAIMKDRDKKFSSNLVLRQLLPSLFDKSP